MSNDNQEVALIEEITEVNAPAIYGHNGLDQFYEKVKAQVCGEVPDLTTEKGRKRIASLSGKVSSSKTAVEKPGREYLKRLKDLPKTIEKELREFVDKMDALRDEVRKPLTDYETKEKNRVAYHESMIRGIIDCGNGFIGGQPQPFAILFRELEEKIIVDEKWEEFEARGHREKAAATEKLNAAFAEQQKRSEEQAELERLRAEAAKREQKEREERIAREAAENARIAAEKAAADERQRLADEQARKDAEAKAAIERAEREKVDAENARLRQQHEAEQAAAKAKQDAIDAAARVEREKQAAIEAERKRQADAAEAERLAAEQREKNKAHAKKINNELLADFMAIEGANITEEQGKLIIAALARKQLRHASVSY